MRWLLLVLGLLGAVLVAGMFGVMAYPMYVESWAREVTAEIEDFEPRGAEVSDALESFVEDLEPADLTSLDLAEWGEGEASEERRSELRTVARDALVRREALFEPYNAALDDGTFWVREPGTGMVAFLPELHWISPRRALLAYGELALWAYELDIDRDRDRLERLRDQIAIATHGCMDYQNISDAAAGIGVTTYSIQIWTSMVSLVGCPPEAPLPKLIERDAEPAILDLMKKARVQFLQALAGSVHGGHPIFADAPVTVDESQSRWFTAISREGALSCVEMLELEISLLKRIGIDEFIECADGEWHTEIFEQTSWVTPYGRMIPATLYPAHGTIAKTFLENERRREMWAQYERVRSGGDVSDPSFAVRKLSDGSFVLVDLDPVLFDGDEPEEIPLDLTRRDVILQTEKARNLPAWLLR